jgi:hypothetical protein
MDVGLIKQESREYKGDEAASEEHADFPWSLNFIEIKEESGK